MNTRVVGMFGNPLPKDVGVVSAGDIQQLGNSRTMIRFIMHLCKAVIEVIP